MNEQNPENGQDGKPPSSLSLRLSSVITFIFLSTAAIVIAYIWGVMVGRSGGVPEYAKNEIVRNETKKEIDTPAKNSTQAILAPQDLDYARVLRNEKARERIKQSTPGKAEPEKNPTTENAIASTAQATEKPAEILDKKSGDTDLKPTAETTAQNNTAGMFDYVFQLGAFGACARECKGTVNFFLSLCCCGVLPKGRRKCRPLPKIFALASLLCVAKKLRQPRNEGIFIMA